MQGNINIKLVGITKDYLLFRDKWGDFYVFGAGDNHAMSEKDLAKNFCFTIEAETEWIGNFKNHNIYEITMAGSFRLVGRGSNKYNYATFSHGQVVSYIKDVLNL